MDYNAEKQVFEVARKLYDGSKLGLETEFTYFRKCHKDWREVLPKLKPAIEAQIRWRENAGDKFRPGWKGFSSWIYNRYWELEVEDEVTDKSKQQHTCYVCDSEAVRGSRNTLRGHVWDCGNPECIKIIDDKFSDIFC